MGNYDFTYKDATLTISAGMSGFHWARVSCRGFIKMFSNMTDMLEWIYPQLDKAADFELNPQSPPITEPDLKK